MLIHVLATLRISFEMDWISKKICLAEREFMKLLNA